ncbi:flippase-like domain-containing protein [Streptomyces sp. SID13666]|uniref:lysylphosphatidylglycerol synthase transmembrane domain-containing protein n=1 Tax=Streptomyces TaxID=1883 RepID=UPI001106BC0C|nr:MULTISPECIES: lysylphosphatidylglycerol synthase transmembrane domain-containing protein [Streptomyces]MCM2424527.1 flippase-like domain-containing protein [Streptomyces sp. RKAG337]NEA57575.1 flippase-like domain-containing protein [Streptomyces sp. SID13666]NEA70921.1 flippase-like domain-containing protein [Streptomyces sp. SID13588]QNA76689.1 flippase-like domain-containing protein [Streptomyces sp. So13.3]
MTLAQAERVKWQGGWQRTSVRSMAVLIPVLALAVLAGRRWSLIDSSADQLGAADRQWLAVAAAAAVMTWICSATAQQGAVVESLPPGRLLATQFAASAANHLLPAGVGGNAVNLRFLLRRGLPPGRSAAALGVRAVAAAVVRVGMLLILLAVFPHALKVDRVTPAGPAHPVVIVSVVAGCAVAGALLLLLAGRVRDRVRTFFGTMVVDVRALHCKSARVAALWGGSLAFPVMHATVLVAVIQALNAPVPVSGVVLAYLFASTAAAWLPAPGGLGSLDAALAFTLVTAGASAVVATSAVLGYRLVTVWLPLIPGVLVLAALMRRRVL